jgi:hypothetical protein
MKSLKQLLDDKVGVDPTSPGATLGAGLNRYVSREFQDYGYRLAMELQDEAHKSLYIRLAKTVDRAILEQCRSFVLDSNANNKGALFMWKMKELKKNKLT